MSPGADVPIGVYRGPKVDIGPYEVYEELLGHSVGLVLAFMADTPGFWAQFEAATLAVTTNGGPGHNIAADWVPQLGARNLALAVPACCCGTTWADEASGKNDAHWTALGENLVAAGLGGSVLRIGREFNGSWYRWKVTEGLQATYKDAYDRIVSLLRTVPGAEFRFCWNPYLGAGNLTSHGTESCYPGDAVVDEIGIDLYDGDWTGIYPGNAGGVTTAQQQQVWDRMLTQWDSLRGWYSLALAHGKPLSFPEWGLRLWKDSSPTGPVYHGGGDNAVLVRGMGEFVAGCGASWHAMWEDGLVGVAAPDDAPGRLCAVPMARAAFLTAFGS